MTISDYLLIGAFVFIVGGCSKNDDVSSSSNTGGANNTSISIYSPSQYTAKINGITYSKEDNGSTIDGFFCNDEQFFGNPDTCIKNYGSGLHNTDSFETYLVLMHNGHIFPGYIAEHSAFMHYFDPGNYAYAHQSVSGFSIRWTDSNGTIWGTDLGSADQTGSTFNIDELIEATVSLHYTIKILAHFNCKLYDGSGNSKTLTDGIYVGFYEN